jgi:hypothetical protein
MLAGPSAEGIDALDLVQLKISDCNNAADLEGKAFWRRVWLCVMTTKHGGKVHVIDDDHRKITT